MIAFPLVQKLVSLKATYTGNYLWTIFRNIIDFDDSFDWTVLLQSFRVKNVNLQLERSIEFGTFGSFVAQFD